MMILKSFLTVNTLFLVCLLSTNVMGGNVRRRVLDGVPHRNLQVSKGREGRAFVTFLHIIATTACTDVAQ